MGLKEWKVEKKEGVGRVVRYSSPPPFHSTSLLLSRRLSSGDGMADVESAMGEIISCGYGSFAKKISRRWTSASQLKAPRRSHKVPRGVTRGFCLP